MALNQADEFIQKLKVQVKVPQQMFEVRVQTYHGDGWDATGTTSGATANEWEGIKHGENIKSRCSIICGCGVL